MPSLHVDSGQRSEQTLAHAEAFAGRLQAALAMHNIPAHQINVGSEVAVSLWHDLIAHCDGCLIWWTSPRQSRRGTKLCTFAYSPETAATRLALHYALVRGIPPESVYVNACQGDLE